MDKYELSKQVRQDIYDTKPPKSVKVVTKNSNGTYNLIASDGTQYNNVRPQTRDKFKANNWVTMEFAGGDWAVVGQAVIKGGD